MNIPIGHPILAGGVEWLIGSSRPAQGVEVSTGLADSTAFDITAWLSPEQAELLALCLLVAAREVRAERARLADAGRWCDFAAREAGA